MLTSVKPSFHSWALRVLKNEVSNPYANDSDKDLRELADEILKTAVLGALRECQIPDVPPIKKELVKVIAELMISKECEDEVFLECAMTLIELSTQKLQQLIRKVASGRSGSLRDRFARNFDILAWRGIDGPWNRGQFVIPKSNSA